MKLKEQCTECRGVAQHKLSCSQRDDAGARFIMQLIPEPKPQPKPRLGDYYAGLEHREFFDALFRHAPPWVGFAYAVFRSSQQQLPGTPQLTIEHQALVGDVFAFGATKYAVGDWRNLSSDDHMQGAGRHFAKWLEDPQSKDEESGLLHEAHFLARAIMCLEMRRVGK